MAPFGGVPLDLILPGLAEPCRTLPDLAEPCRTLLDLAGPCVAYALLQVALPLDYLAREGEVLGHVAFIEHGKVDVYVNEGHVAEMGDGSYLGEISALGLGGRSSPDGLCLATASVRATDVCAIHVISRKDFAHLMYQFPEVLSAVTAVAQLRLARASNAPPDAKNGRTSVAAERCKQSHACCRQMNALTDEDVHAYVRQQQEEEQRLTLQRERRDRESAGPVRERSEGRRTSSNPFFGKGTGDNSFGRRSAKSLAVPEGQHRSSKRILALQRTFRRASNLPGSVSTAEDPSPVLSSASALSSPVPSSDCNGSPRPRRLLSASFRSYASRVCSARMPHSLGRRRSLLCCMCGVPSMLSPSDHAATNVHPLPTSCCSVRRTSSCRSNDGSAIASPPSQATSQGTGQGISQTSNQARPVVTVPPAAVSIVSATTAQSGSGTCRADGLHVRFSQEVV